MPKYQVNKEAIEAYLKENPLNLLTIADNKPIHLNLKIAKSDLAFLEKIFRSEDSDITLNKKSEWINLIVESLIVDAYKSISKDSENDISGYMYWKMAETVDLVLQKKHKYVGSDKFSWVKQFIGGQQDIAQIDCFWDDFFSREPSAKKLSQAFDVLLSKYVEKVVKNESSK